MAQNGGPPEGFPVGPDGNPLQQPPEGFPVGPDGTPLQQPPGGIPVGPDGIWTLNAASIFGGIFDYSIKGLF